MSKVRVSNCGAAHLEASYEAFRTSVGSLAWAEVRSRMSRTRDVRTMPLSGWLNSILISRQMNRSLSMGVPQVDP